MTVPCVEEPHLVCPSSINGHPSGFHLYDVVNILLLQGCRKLLETLFLVLLGVCPEVGLPGHIVILLNFGRNHPTALMAVACFALPIAAHSAVLYHVLASATLLSW